LSKFRTSLLTVLGLILMSGLVTAQVPTGKIIGTVMDDSGIPLPGVSVEAKSPTMVGKSSVLTDESGVYRLFALPPGTYEIKYSLPGFNTVVRKDIVVRLEETITVDITMEPGAIEEEITVLGRSPLIDVKSTYKGMTMSKEMFQMLPRGRNFDTLVTAIPGVSNEPWLGGISVDGASGAENMYYIDGTDITEMERGQRGQSAAFEFVDEIQIKASGYQAEYGGAVGGVVSVITRSGGNEFHGELIGYYSGSRLEGKERDTLRLVPTNTALSEYVNYQDLYGKDTTDRYEVGFSLGGYVLKDRLWFFGSFLPVFDNTMRHVTFTVNDEKRDSPHKYKYWNFQAKVTAQPMGNLRLSGSFVNNFSKYKGDLPPRDGSGNPDTDYAAYGYSYPNWSTAGSADLTLGANFLVSLRGGYFFRNQNNQLVAPTEPCYQFLVETAGYASVTNQHMDIPDQYKRDAGYVNYPRGQAFAVQKTIRSKGYVNLDLNYFLDLGGEHSLKAGVQWVRQLEDVDSTAPNPVLFLAWDRDLILGGVNYGRGTYGFYSVRGNDATGPYGSFYQPHSIRWALYVQDSWTPEFLNNRLTLNFGVRTEREYVPPYNDDPAFLAELQAEGYSINPIEFDFSSKIAPRLGFVYDVFGDATTKIFGSYGWYFDIFKLYMGANAYGGFKWKSAYYALDTYEWDTIGVSGNYPGTPLGPGVVDWRHPSYESTDPDLKPMSQREISFGAERKLSEFLAASVRVVQKHLRYTIEDVGVFVPGVGEEYYTTNPGYGYSQHVGEGTGRFDPKYPPCPKAKREYWAVNFALDKRFSDNWMAGFSYTWSRLTGNYSGLASSDEYGRVSPNVERYFDLWHLAYTKDLDPQDGPLPTDRTHQFKFYGSYVFPFGVTVGTVINGVSGTPVTEEWTVEANGYYPYNRGNLGRTPFLFFANLYAEYNLRFAEKYTLQFNVNVDNVLNTGTARRIWSRKTSGRVDVSEDELLSKNWDLTADRYVADPRFNMEQDFYPPISVRFGLKFIF
jgi:hypothetical protein